MTTLALFVPTPKLAELTDPLDFARETPASVLPTQEFDDWVAERAAVVLPPAGNPDPSLSPDTWYWAAPFKLGDWTENTVVAEPLQGDSDAHDHSGFAAHLEEADQAARGEVPLGGQPSDLAEWVGLIGACGPANVAWRAFRRNLSSAEWLDDATLQQCASIVGAGFNSLFNRPDVIALIDSETSETVYWKAVLEYCKNGNLQAVIDEYFHHILGGSKPTSPKDLLEIAQSIRSAIALRMAQTQAFDPADPDNPIRMNIQFAVRFGTAKGKVDTSEQGIARAGNVRDAFNSPFWPMVLASTSVGQEGIDFHWWCHAIVHWNLPANPTDFEQREGRVNRFKGHAVRKNVASEHRTRALESDSTDPWDSAFDAAASERPEGVNEMWPWWIYPGDAEIERHVAAFPLSKDQIRNQNLKRQRALYRLAFGQPRQEDMVEMLGQAGLGDEKERIGELRIDLTPPND